MIIRLKNKHTLIQDNFTYKCCIGKNGTSSSNNSVPNLTPHGDLDQPFSVFLGTDLEEGTHEIVVRITEQGNPWENIQVYSWSLVISSEPAVHDNISE